MNPQDLNQIQKMIEDTFEKKIDGKLMGIVEHLNRQDKVSEQMLDLLADRDFIIKLWAFMKFLGGVAVAVGSAVLLYNKIKQ